MADLNTAAPAFYPTYVNDVLALLGRIRDFHGVKADQPPSGDVRVSNNNVMLGWQFDALFDGTTGIIFDMLRFSRMTINNIRDVHNYTPILEVPEPELPDPDPLDGYYFPYGVFGYTNESHPTSDSPLSPPPYRMLLSPRPLAPRPLGPLPLPRPPRPRPPWPPWPPPPPPPTYWRPTAEEDYSYVYAYWTLISGYTADRTTMGKSDLEYTGYYAMQMAKRCWELYKFWHPEFTVQSYFEGVKLNLQNTIL